MRSAVYKGYGFVIFKRKYYAIHAIYTECPIVPILPAKLMRIKARVKRIFPEYSFLTLGKLLYPFRQPLI